MKLTHAWHADKPYWPVLHDPLTLAVAVNNGWAQTKRFAVDVVVEPGPMQGATVVVPDREPTIYGRDRDRWTGVRATGSRKRWSEWSAREAHRPSDQVVKP